MTLAVVYFVFSSFLLMIGNIDICIPCLWKTIFGIDCPACGMTAAFIQLMQLKIQGASEANPMIFLVLPAGAFYFIKDVMDFKKKTIRV